MKNRPFDSALPKSKSKSKAKAAMRKLRLFFPRIKPDEATAHRTTALGMMAEERPTAPRFNFARRSKTALFLAATFASAFGGKSARAANYYWDADGNPIGDNPVTGTSLGGTGAWDTTSLFWYNPATRTDIAWPNLLTDTATFTGTAGTVTIAGGGINAGAVQFFTTAYTLAGGTLALGQAGTNVYVNSGTATISSVITGTNGLGLAGGGTLVLNGAASNTYTGATSISGGSTLNLNFANNATDIINPASNLVLNNGALTLTGAAGATPT